MISTKHKCIFIHIPKCGGKSVEQIFIEECNLDMVSREQLLLRNKKKTEKGPLQLSHLTANQYTEYGYINSELFDEYFKFCLVRNPYSRVESLYHYLGFSYAIDFPTFIRKVLPLQATEEGKLHHYFRPQYQYVYDDERASLLDSVIKLEELKNLYGVLDKLDILVQSIPHINARKNRGFRRKLRYRLRYLRAGFLSFNIKINDKITWSNSEIRIVNSLYADDFECFGYGKI